MARNLMKLECELAGAKAALQTLSSSEITLRKACEEHQSLVQQLHEKQKRIEEYASRTVRILVMLQAYSISLFFK